MQNYLYIHTLLLCFYCLPVSAAVEVLDSPACTVGVTGYSTSDYVLGAVGALGLMSAETGLFYAARRHALTSSNRHHRLNESKRQSLGEAAYMALVGLINYLKELAVPTALVKTFLSVGGDYAAARQLLESRHSLKKDIKELAKEANLEHSALELAVSLKGLAEAYCFEAGEPELAQVFHVFYRAKMNQQGLFLENVLDSVKDLHQGNYAEKNRKFYEMLLKTWLGRECLNPDV